MKKLQKNIYYHTTSDGMNLGCIIGDDGPISIDLPMTPEEALSWRAQIAALSDKPLRAVLFTSADRVSSEALAAIAPHPGPLSIPSIIHDAGFAQLYAALEASQPKSPEPLTPAQLREQAVLPDVTFTDSTTLVVGSANPLFVDIKHVGGYSPCSAIVVVRDANIVFAGDLVTSREPPSLTRGNLDQWSATLTDLKRSLKTAAIVPGRGPVADVDAISETLAYLKAARSAVQKLIRGRKTRADVSAIVPELLAAYSIKPGKPRRGGADPGVIERRVLLSLESLFDQLSKAQEQMDARPVEG
jgi:glyoxylase-like metal-dependent hydrolase (beta-lactamase superfamily II)